MSRLITFGCSFTVGTGLTDSSQTWPVLLSALTKRTLVNKGIPGSSNLEILNNILSFKFKKDDIVVIGWTYCHRDIVFNKLSPDIRINIGSEFFTQHAKLHSNYDNNVRSGIYIHHTDLYMNSLGIKHYNFWAPPTPDHIIDRVLDSTIGKYVGSKPNFINGNTLHNNILNMVDIASDNSHPGPISHRIAAEKLHRIINGE
jgi:hypothetical protein